jgi:DNA-binding NarL/FixJ family response regulator
MQENAPIRLSIADSQKTFRHGIRLALNAKEQLQIAWEAETGRELLARLDEEKPDILLMNLAISGDVRAIPMLRHVYNPLKIIILTVHNDPGFISKIMETGASACFPRATNPEEIYRAMLACRRQGYYFDNLTSKLGLSVAEVKRIYQKVVNLSEKEVRLLQLLAQDMITKDISHELRLSARRVEALRQDIKAKTGAKTIAGLIALGVRNKLID